MLWEAHKCVIKGEFIAITTEVRKRHKQKISSLLDKIKTLEATHKRSLMQSVLEELTAARNALLDDQCQFALSHKFFYENGNKNGRLLPCMLRAKRATHMTHQDPRLKRHTPLHLRRHSTGFLLILRRPL